jgi:hypothetical protein
LVGDHGTGAVEGEQGWGGGREKGFWGEIFGGRTGNERIQHPVIVLCFFFQKKKVEDDYSSITKVVKVSLLIIEWWVKNMLLATKDSMILHFLYLSTIIQLNPTSTIFLLDERKFYNNQPKKLHTPISISKTKIPGNSTKNRQHHSNFTDPQRKI